MYDLVKAALKWGQHAYLWKRILEQLMSRHAFCVHRSTVSWPIFANTVRISLCGNKIAKVHQPKVYFTGGQALYASRLTQNKMAIRNDWIIVLVAANFAFNIAAHVIVIAVIRKNKKRGV